MHSEVISQRRSGLTQAQRERLTNRIKGTSPSAEMFTGVTRRPQRESAPLSFSQDRLWFLDQLRPGDPAYNIRIVTRFHGAFDKSLLERVINEIVDRHEILRTRFCEVDGQPQQIIDQIHSYHLADHEIVSAEELAERDVMRLVFEEGMRPFDLTRGPLFRLRVLRLSGEEHLVAMTIHHIISDGWSLRILAGEIRSLYSAFMMSRPSPLTELPVQYGDYATWQRSRLTGKLLEEQLQYWRNRLFNAPVLDIPTDRVRPPLQSSNGAIVSVDVPPELTQAVLDLSVANRATVFMTLLAGFKIVLSHWAGQRDVVVGTPIAGRTDPSVERLIGLFINTLALRTDLSGNPTFVEVLDRVRDVTLGAYTYQDLPFDKVVEAVKPARDLSRSPIFQVMVNSIDFKTSSTRLEDGVFEVDGSILAADRTNSKFDLNLYLTTQDSIIKLDLVYNRDLFDASTIERVLARYLLVLEKVVANPLVRLSELSLLTEDERRRVLVEWNDTREDYPRNRCLHDLFSEQAARTPDAIAVIGDDRRLTYDELDRRSNRLAHYLRRLGVGPEVVVGLCIQRSPELLVGLLGILKAGGVYLPLDPSYPAERLGYMLADAKAAVLVTEEGLAARLPSHEARAVRLDTDWPEIQAQSRTTADSGVTPENLAYVLFTSGSTGRPKAVMICHRGVVNYFSFLIRRYGLNPDHTVLHVSSISFDPSIRDLLGPLLSGGRLVLMHPSDERSPRRYLEMIRDHRVTTLLSITPSLLEAVVNSGAGQFNGTASLRQVLTCGEALPYSLCSMAGEVFSSAQIVNQYGPTECTMSSSYHPVARSDDKRGVVPLGKPIPNCVFYLLDDELNPVPIGTAGELFIGGEGLARGYFGRPGLTAERFLPSAFGEGRRLYRTGDRARWRSDGELEFLGRTDRQVKLRGYRIELGEIEAALRECPGIKSTVVVARGDGPGDRRLIAYLVAEAALPANEAELRSRLKQALPDYMMPAAFVVLERWPLTPNGKIDREALPAPEGRPEVAEYVPPRTPTEQALAAIWADILKLDRVGVQDNFFDLGGHSLLATRLAARVRDEMGTTLPLRTIFDAPTVAGLAGLLADDDEETIMIKVEL
jgi:pristinamycin I synthase 3 and 4